MRTHLRGFHSLEDDFAASESRDEAKQSPITNHQSPNWRFNHDSFAQCKRLRGSAFLQRH